MQKLPEIDTAFFIAYFKLALSQLLFTINVYSLESKEIITQ